MSHERMRETEARLRTEVAYNAQAAVDGERQIIDPRKLLAATSGPEARSPKPEARLPLTGQS